MYINWVQYVHINIYIYILCVVGVWGVVINPQLIAMLWIVRNLLTNQLPSYISADHMNIE